MAIVTAAQLKKRLGDLLEISSKDADDILWAVQEVCLEAVQSGDSIKLPGVGTLQCRVQAARKARNPATGEPVKVPAKVVVKFRIDNKLKQQAPALKSKQGKALLEEAEEKQASREKARRKRERAESHPKKDLRKSGRNARLKRLKATSRY